MKTLIFFIGIFAFISCKKEVSSVSVSTFQNPSEIKSDYLQIEQIDYTRVLISNSEQFVFNQPFFTDLIIYSENDTSFTIDTLQAFTLTQTGKDYLCTFKYELNIDKHLINFPLHLQFILNDGSTLTYDSTLNMLKFPYSSTEVFLEWATRPEEGVTDVQDFELDDRYLFFHPYGCAGTYKYDLNSKQVTQILDYCGGDFLAYDADSGYVFMDIEHNSIWKYDLQQDTSMALYDLTEDHTIFLGMTAQAGSLFAICQNWLTSEPIKMVVLDYQGQVLKQFVLDDSNIFSLYQLDIYDDSFFTFTFTAPNKIQQYDLLFQNQKEIKAPTDNTESISIFEPYLYFSDYDKQIIGRTLLSEILSSASSTEVQTVEVSSKYYNHEQKNLTQDF